MIERNIGIDLAVKGTHTAQVLSSYDEPVGKSFSFDTTKEGLEKLVKRALKDTDGPIRLNFVMEPTSMAWLPISAYLIDKGHRVFLVSTQKSSDLRKFLRRHTKSDNIDAMTLAKLPMIDKSSLHELSLPTADLQSLYRYVKQRDKLAKSVTKKKLRIIHMFSYAIPKLMSVFGKNKFTQVNPVRRPSAF